MKASVQRARLVLPQTTSDFRHAMWPFSTAFVAGSPIADVDIREGDVVLVASGGTSVSARTLSTLRGWVHRLPRRDLPILLQHFGELRLALAYAVVPEQPQKIVRKVMAGLRQSLASTVRVGCCAEANRAPSPVVIVRPWVSPVSCPVHARSDDAALFDLLTSVGCTLPREAA